MLTAAAAAAWATEMMLLLWRRCSRCGDVASADVVGAAGSTAAAAAEVARWRK